MASPPMDVEKARLILKDVIQVFGVPENKARFMAANEQVLAAPQEQRAMMKMQILIPIVTELAGGKLAEHGLPNVMMGVMQIQMVAGSDPVVAEGVQLLTQCASGNIPDDAAIEAFSAKL
mmetsp:Transcript_35147/g.71655  ORF Transcript_35147/g.71655 Transcript_35147/m.71655 type:complete len:120 (-) Transcript_35147:2-361(-)